MRIKIREVAHHRNGCFGEPFHAVRFTAEGESLVALVFQGEGRVAVLDPARAVETVAFGVNSWRGDAYEAALRAGIADHEAAAGERVGGFGARQRARRAAKALSGPEIGSNVVPFGGKTRAPSMESGARA